MTVLVGVKCTDGVVIGADSAATSAAGPVHLLKMASDKIEIVGGRVIVAGTGQIGLGQRFAKIVSDAHEAKVFQGNRVDVAKKLSAGGVADLGATGASRGQYGALVAAPIEDDGCLIEFAINDFQPEIKTQKLNFVAMGSGQMLAEPFVSFVARTFWQSKMPDVQSAIFGVHWALAHTIRCAPGGVGDPIVIATLTKQKKGWCAELLPDEVLGEQAQHMAAIEDVIANYKEKLLEGVEAAPPPEPA
jgi:20S proteasome alpha/beta subunit